MLITKLLAHEKKNTPLCTVWEYEFPSKELGIATAHIQGRYPEQGKAVNHVCDEMYYVISGRALVHHETGDFEIQTGDCFFFEKEKAYWIEADDLHIVLPTAPARYPEQYEHRE